MKIYKYGLLGLLSTLLLSGCGFHFRQGNDLPPRLHQITIQSDDPYAPFISQFEELMTGLGVEITPKAPLILRISELQFSHNEPKLTSTRHAVHYTYTLSATVSIMRKRPQKLVAQKHFRLSTRQLMNANQIFTTSTNVLAHSALRQELRTRLFEWLTSKPIRKRLGNDKNGTSPGGNHSVTTQQ